MLDASRTPLFATLVVAPLLVCASACAAPESESADPADDFTSSEGAAGDGAGGAGSGSGGQGLSVGGSGSGGDSGSGASGGTPGGGGGSSVNPGLSELGTLVVLGDSIGDGGGQAPYYYALLRDKLEAKYGPIAYHREAESGSETGALMGQIGDLPNSLPGPVAVTITSGGNDMKAAIQWILLGVDAPVRAQMGANLDAALTELLSPGRFGPGVEVHVFEGNVYDASDGKGDYGAHDCNFGGGFPTIPNVDAYFDAWNGVIAEQVAAHGQTLVDMHASFYGHGYDGSPSWYASDCTHPNSAGHAALADFFYAEIAGD